jgi:malate dehydrogenase (oxaloacetate-decarboxylating)(NADP+)
MTTLKKHKTNRTLPTRGVDWLHNPVFNKGTAFTESERDALGLHGLLPPYVQTIDQQARRVMETFRSKSSDLERYIQIVGLQDRNETLFYRVVMDNLEELMPIIYTPTVGKACQEFGHIFRRSRGFYISSNDRGQMEKILLNWPTRQVKVIVVTDGERILGLGDLGAFGMGIPIGKLSLYTACAGIHPMQCLPITIDVGTDNETLLADPLYTGLRQKRTRGEEYDSIIEEFMLAVEKNFPGVLVQFEDFGNSNAFRLLERYRDRACTFNDDIQGTGAVALAGILAALRISGQKLADQRFLFLGAGSAALGMAQAISEAMRLEGMDVAEARSRIALFNTRGLVVKSRADLKEFQKPFAQDRSGIPSFLDAVKELRPTGIIGVSTVPKLFDREVIAAMAELNERPIIFPYSNPTSRSECTAEEAYRWSNGRAIFASGSPFPPVQFGGRTFVPGQGNNVYIFPAVGMAIFATEARRVTDGMFIVAARAVAEQMTDQSLANGLIYPPQAQIFEASLHVATRVAEYIFDQDLARVPRPRDIGAHIRASAYRPGYAA